MSSTGKNIGKGIFYTAISKYSEIFVSIFISAILARLLTPAEFGVVAIIMVFISFFNLISNLGFAPAIVQNKSLSQEDIESLFTFIIIFGLFISLIFFLIAPLIAIYYENPVLTNLARLMSLVILFQTLQIVPRALCRKNLMFKHIGIVSVAVHIIGGSLAIFLAYHNFSYYAIILNSILSGLLSFIAFYYLKPIKVSFKLDFQAIRKIAKFSIFQFLFNFINYFSRNADNLLIGKYIGVSSLGFYDKAYRLMTIPVQNLTHVITPVLHPVLSEHHNNKYKIYKSYYVIVRILATIGFPLSVLLYFSSYEIINIMYGSQWQESIPVFKLLALSVGIQIVLSSTGSIFQAANRADLMFYSGLLSSILMLSGIVYGVFIGKTLVSVGTLIFTAFSINFFQGFYFLIKKALNRSFFKFLKVFFFPLESSFFLGIALSFFERLSIENIVLSLLLKIITFLILLLIMTPLSKLNRSLFQQYFSESFKKYVQKFKFN